MNRSEELVSEQVQHRSRYGEPKDSADRCSADLQVRNCRAKKKTSRNIAVFDTNVSGEANESFLIAPTQRHLATVFVPVAVMGDSLLS